MPFSLFLYPPTLLPDSKTLSFCGLEGHFQGKIGENSFFPQNVFRHLLLLSECLSYFLLQSHYSLSMISMCYMLHLALTQF